MGRCPVFAAEMTSLFTSEAVLSLSYPVWVERETRNKKRKEINKERKSREVPLRFPRRRFE